MRLNILDISQRHSFTQPLKITKGQICIFQNDSKMTHTNTLTLFTNTPRQDVKFVVTQIEIRRKGLTLCLVFRSSFLCGCGYASSGTTRSKTRRSRLKLLKIIKNDFIISL